MPSKTKDEYIIEVSNLTKFYGKTKGIENVSFHIKKGEIYGLMGPNGAGKTTTLRSMLNLIQSSSGETRIFSKNLLDLSKIEMSNISYLPGEFEMYGNLTGKEYLKLDQKKLIKFKNYQFFCYFPVFFCVNVY